MCGWWSPTQTTTGSPWTWTWTWRSQPARPPCSEDTNPRSSSAPGTRSATCWPLGEPPFPPLSQPYSLLSAFLPLLLLFLLLPVFFYLRLPLTLSPVLIMVSLGLLSLSLSLFPFLSRYHLSRTHVSLSVSFLSLSSPLSFCLLPSLSVCLSSSLSLFVQGNHLNLHSFLSCESQFSSALPGHCAPLGLLNGRPIFWVRWRIRPTRVPGCGSRACVCIHGLLSCRLHRLQHARPDP